MKHIKSDIFLIYIPNFLGKKGKTTFSKVLNTLISVKNTKEFYDIFTKIFLALTISQIAKTVSGSYVKKIWSVLT